MYFTKQTGFYKLLRKKRILRTPKKIFGFFLNVNIFAEILNFLVEVP